MDLLGQLQSTHGYIAPRPGFVRAVGETADLQRIRDAERREWHTEADLEELRTLLTAHLRHTDNPCAEPDRCEGCLAKALNPAQAAFLRELHDAPSGAVGALRVGAGKTLVSLLAPTVLKAQRALLLVPKALEAKTLNAARQYARHWRVGAVRVIGYELLSHPDHKDDLETDLKPDLIIADEAWKLQNSSSKACKRLSKYLRAHPECRFVPLSGSMSGRSIKENWHYVRWALRSQAPVPHDPLEMAAWAYAMDEKVPPEARFDPSALLTLAPSDASKTPIERAREAYGKRFVTTRGVVSTLEDIPPTGLRLWTSALALPPAALEALTKMRKTWQTPDGADFCLAVDLWRHARTLGVGLYYRWDPAAPKEWMDARRAWNQFAREALKHSRSIDSTVHIQEAIDAGQLHDNGVLNTWRELRPTFVPNPVAVWVHHAMVDHAARWLAEHPHGLVWTEHSAYGEELARASGVPHYTKKGCDASGRLVDDHRAGPAVVSVKGCGFGHNLQYFRDNLLVSPLSKGNLLEQLLGRTHRDGQLADEVTADFVLTCKESRSCLAQAIRDARFAQETSRQPQKLCYATWDSQLLDLNPEAEHEGP